MKRLKDELIDMKYLLRSIPSMLILFFCLSVILMNLFANKEISTGIDVLVLDCGVTLSWISFLCMDVITKRFGSKEAIKITILAILVNLSVCAVFRIVAFIPCNWGEYYNLNSEIANRALDNTLGGTWYVLAGSTLAIFISSVVNSKLNELLGKVCKSTGFQEFAFRSYISTGVGQFCDNLVFCFLVSHTFFGWTMKQVIVSALAQAVIELVIEIIFSPVGYRVLKKWEQDNVGEDYLKWKSNLLKEDENE